MIKKYNKEEVKNINSRSNFSGNTLLIILILCSVILSFSFIYLNTYNNSSINQSSNTYWQYLTNKISISNNLLTGKAISIPINNLGNDFVSNEPDTSSNTSLLNSELNTATIIYDPNITSPSITMLSLQGISDNALNIQGAGTADDLAQFIDDFTTGINLTTYMYSASNLNISGRNISGNGMILVNRTVVVALNGNGYLTTWKNLSMASFNLSVYINLTNTSSTLTGSSRITAGVFIVNQTNDAVTISCKIFMNSTGRYYLNLNKGFGGSNDFTTAITSNGTGIIRMGFVNSTKVFNCSFGNTSLNTTSTTVGEDYGVGIRGDIMSFPTQATGSIYALFDNFNYSLGQTSSNTIYPSLSFISPTPNNATNTTNTYVIINISITKGTNSISEIKYNWNGTNYTFYNNSLLLMMNFDNLSSLGEDSTQIIDLSKYGNNGTVNGAAVWTNLGKYNGAYNLIKESSQYISLSTSSVLTDISTNDYTLSAWVNPNKYVLYSNIININNEALVQTNNNKWGLVHAGDVIQCSNSTINTNTWTHIVGVKNGSSYYIYVNGVYDVGTFVGDNGYGFQNQYFIGKGYLNYAYYFNGSIDEVRIWNRSLSTSEVYQEYISNLQKYNSTQWYLSVNQSKNALFGLDIGTYTYFSSAKDSSGNENSTGINTITIESQSNNNDSNYGFELGALTNWTTGGDANWFAQSTTKIEGSYAAESGNIADNQITWMNRSVTVDNYYNLSFMWKVSSEANWDYLLFCPDTPSCTRTTGYNSRIAGTQDWVENSYLLTSGTHILHWAYAKDSSADSGVDTAWLDNLTLQQINISDPVINLPINNSLIFNVTPTFSWNNSITNQGTNTYELIVDDNADFSSAILNTTISETSISTNYTIISSLTTNTNYYWKVRGYNGLIYSNWVSSSFYLTDDINNYKFELGALTNWTTGGDANWFAQSTTKIEGSYAAESGNIADNQITWMNRSVTVDNYYNLSFMWKVSSEANWDYLLFCPDTPSCTRTTGYNSRIDGTQDWVENSYLLTSGTHILHWAYAKDSSQDSGVDTAWLDNITFKQLNLTDPIIINPTNASITTTRTPTLVWNNSVSNNGGTISYELMVDNDSDFSSRIISTTVSEGVVNTSYTIEPDLSVDSTFYWKVRGYNGLIYSNWVNAEFNILSSIAVSLPTNSIDFGNLSAGESKNTTNGSYTPIIISNDGNVPINIFINATNLFNAIGSDIPGSYQFNITPDEINPYGSVVGEWTNLNSTEVQAITSLFEENYTNTANTANLNVRIKAPSDEGMGIKSSTIIIRAIASN